MRKFLFFVLFVIFIIGGGAYFFRGKISVVFLEFSKAQLPRVTKGEVLVTLASRDTEINLDVPFSSQAPLKDWGMPYQEACEEMSAILVNEFYQRRKFANQSVLNPASANQAIQKLVAWEQLNFGFYKHTTAVDTARILREYFGLRGATVRYDITLQDLKREVAAGKPVIVPLAGRKVGNIYYRRPGPIYHMLVVRGFTDDGRIITNDVGTQHGENYPYDEEVFFDAIHDAPSSGDGDLTEEEIERGRKAMIVVME